MLTSIVLIIRPGEDCGLPPTLGNAVHGCFLNLIQGLEPALAVQLHDSKGEKLFTASLLQGPLSTKAELLHLRKGDNYWLRFTSLNLPLSLLLWELSAGSVGRIRLFDAEFQVAKVAKLPEEHPWAGQSSFEELYNNGVALARGGKDGHMIGLQFASPTAFRLVDSRLNMPLPWPHLVFQSLAKKWNAFSPIPLWIDWSAFDRLVTVARHRLETRMLDFSRYHQVGFVGECWYLIDRKASSRLVQALHTLADFAFYAGVGAKTTMGMGLTRPIVGG